MDANAPSAAVLEARLSPVWRVQLALRDKSPTQEPVVEPKAEPIPPPQPLVSGEVMIQVDKASGRFVNTLIHPDTKEVLRQYPSETQLAYSRAVRAYLASAAA